MFFSCLIDRLLTFVVETWPNSTWRFRRRHRSNEFDQFWARTACRLSFSFDSTRISDSILVEPGDRSKWRFIEPSIVSHRKTKSFAAVWFSVFIEFSFENQKHEDTKNKTKRQEKANLCFLFSDRWKWEKKTCWKDKNTFHAGKTELIGLIDAFVPPTSVDAASFHVLKRRERRRIDRQERRQSRNERFVGVRFDRRIERWSLLCRFYLSLCAPICRFRIWSKTRKSSKRVESTRNISRTVFTLTTSPSSRVSSNSWPGVNS